MRKLFIAAVVTGPLLLAGCGDSGGLAAKANIGSGGVVLPPVTPNPGVSPTATRDRYSFNNKCVALRDNSTGKYVASSGTGYAATATALSGAEAFFMKPSVLGEYALMNRTGTLMNAAATVTNVAIATATDTASFKLLTDGDTSVYPPAPVYDVPMSKATVEAYRAFIDPQFKSDIFTLANPANGQRLTNNGAGALTMTAGDTPTQRFKIEEVAGCGEYPEAHDNTSGDTFKGSTTDGRVLGFADVHVHTSSSTFLGGALAGKVFHKFGVLQAMPDCAAVHGQQGSKDALSAAYESDTNGHATAGWPTFTEWPQRHSLTHRAIYWKWIERAWKSGLRIMVNDLVENGTLCELQRNANGNPAQDCNEMNSARRQVGTMYALQDYIDAQYGGRGKGFLQMVQSSAEGRSKVAEGKLAVVLGMEISNLWNCQLHYNSPNRQQEPYQEQGVGPTEATYECAMTETGAPNEIKTQLDEMKGLGVRQIISIHEFDNAFGGNGIFDGLILNAGSRENSGGLPSSPTNPPTTTALPTGEFWTTYDCPLENTTPGFSGYLWEGAGGAAMQRLGPPPPAPCPYAGQGGRPGGPTACYPAARQCNARWMTPIGQYMYKKLMENGMIFDFDHMELAMKTQALELAEAQSVAYPFVSTHGTFGGTSNDQAKRTLKNGGFLYPSLGSVRGFLADMAETKAVATAAQSPYLFGFGFGTDTDGLSGQEDPRGSANIAVGKEVKYPFTLFTGQPFASLPDFNGKLGVVFDQPKEFFGTGPAKTWSQDKDGNAHYGMMSDFVEEMRQEGTPQDMQTLFNSAEVYLQTWSRTEAAAAAIKQKGIATPAGMLRSAPKPGQAQTTSPVP